MNKKLTQLAVLGIVTIVSSFIGTGLGMLLDKQDDIYHSMLLIMQTVIPCIVFVWGLRKIVPIKSFSLVQEINFIGVSIALSVGLLLVINYLLSFSDLIVFTTGKRVLVDVNLAPYITLPGAGILFVCIYKLMHSQWKGRIEAIIILFVILALYVYCTLQIPFKYETAFQYSLWVGIYSITSVIIDRISLVMETDK